MSASDRGPMRDYVVSAKNVQVGDRLYDASHYNKADPFNKVTKVHHIPAGRVIITAGYTTVKHPEEGVVIQRAEQSDPPTGPKETLP